MSEVTPHAAPATKLTPRNKMVLVEAIKDPLAPKDDPKKLKVIRSVMGSVCGLVVAVGADCGEWVKRGMVAYHQKEHALGVLLEDGKLYGLVHEEFILGTLDPESTPVECLNVVPTADEAARLLERGQQPGIVVPDRKGRM